VAVYDRAVATKLQAGPAVELVRHPDLIAALRSLRRDLEDHAAIGVFYWFEASNWSPANLIGLRGVVVCPMRLPQVRSLTPPMLDCECSMKTSAERSGSRARDSDRATED